MYYEPTFSDADAGTENCESEDADWGDFFAYVPFKFCTGPALHLGECLGGADVTKYVDTEFEFAECDDADLDLNGGDDMGSTAEYVQCAAWGASG